MESWGDLISELENKVTNLIVRFKNELKGIRQSGVDIDLLKNIQVEAYTSNVMPLYQLATINKKDALTVVISPWDKSIVKNIEEAIKKNFSESRLSTRDEGIIVSFPPLTEESLKTVIKKLRALTEDFRQHLRRVRSYYKSKLDDAKNANEVSEDFYYKYLGKIDDIAKKAREEIEHLSKEKENKILVK